MMNQIFYMWYLLENYSTDPFIKFSRQRGVFYSCRKSDGLAWNKKQLRLVVVECNGKRAGVCNPGGTASTK
jgi:hypothetical protein